MTELYHPFSCNTLQSSPVVLDVSAYIYSTGFIDIQYLHYNYKRNIYKRIFTKS